MRVARRGTALEEGRGSWTFYSAFDCWFSFFLIDRASGTDALLSSYEETTLRPMPLERSDLHLPLLQPQLPDRLLRSLLPKLPPLLLGRFFQLLFGDLRTHVLGDGMARGDEEELDAGVVEERRRVRGDEFGGEEVAEKRGVLNGVSEDRGRGEGGTLACVAGRCSRTRGLVEPAPGVLTCQVSSASVGRRNEGQT